MRTLCALSSVALVTALLAACGDSQPTHDGLDVPAGADAAAGSEDIAAPGDDDTSAPASPADSASGSDAEPEVTQPAPPALPGLGIDYEASEAGASPRYDLNGASWTSTPWPNDRLLDANGTPDLSSFPNPDIDMLHQYVDYAHEVLFGWGLNGSTYVTFDGAIDPESLPSAALTKGFKKATVQTVNATTGSHRYGEQMPLLFWWYGGGEDDPYLEANTLAIRPVFGFPLAEGETYCTIVTRGVKDAQGRYLKPSAAFTEALANEPSLQPLRDWLENAMIVAEDIAVATCFTTDTPTAELRAIQAQIYESPAPSLTDIEYLGKTNVFHEFRGHYETPNYQAGEKPYDIVGGDVKFDDTGTPIVQYGEPVRFVLTVPTAFEMPEAGWPLVLYAHGTGGDVDSCKWSVAEDLSKEGMAILCIEQPLHGERGDDAWFIELLTFNFANPRAGRTNFRQSAADTIVLTRMVSDGQFNVPTGRTEHDETVTFDPDQIHFFGHSQGGLSGALALGVEPALKSAVLSGAGGVLIETILRRKDFADIASLVRALLEVPDANFGPFHPTMALVQLLVDATDPVNYAQYWINPAPGGTAKHVFVTEGINDAATPAVSTHALAASARIPLLTPVEATSEAHELLGMSGVDAPVSLNIVNRAGRSLTAGLKQWDGDHFVAFDITEARNMWRNWFQALRQGFDPQLSP
ncbi:MAG: alpha/beta hydrolase family protein [Myxococcota bacterium]